MKEVVFHLVDGARNLEIRFLDDSASVIQLDDRGGQWYLFSTGRPFEQIQSYIDDGYKVVDIR